MVFVMGLVLLTELVAFTISYYGSPVYPPWVAAFLPACNDHLGDDLSVCGEQNSSENVENYLNSKS